MTVDKSEGVRENVDLSVGMGWQGVGLDVDSGVGECHCVDFEEDDERQLVRFEAGEQTKIAKMVKEMQRDDTLIAFKNLSTIINKAIGMLPTKVIPILQQLYISYSTTRAAIEVGFTSSSDILSKFVIKSWKMMQHGMNKKDQKALMTIGNQLNTFFIDQLDTFVESSRATLVQIQSQLLLEATGGKVQNLLDKRNELETDFLQLSALLTNKSSECGTNQRIIDLLELPASPPKIGFAISGNQTITDTMRSIKNFSSRLTLEYATAKNEMKFAAGKLREQIQDCKNKIQKHHNYLLERGRSVSQMRQKLRNVHAGDMARSDRENIKNLMARTDSRDGTNENLECNTNQGITNLLENRTKVLTKFTGRLEAAREEMMAAIVKLKEQIHDYKNKIQKYHDLRLERRTLFWVYSWKVRDVNAGNGGKIVQENITRLIERTRFFQNIYQNESNLDIFKGLLAGKESLPFYKTKQIQLEQEHKKLKERHDQVSQEFYAVIEEIDLIYRSTGTVNLESIKMVDELCRAVQRAQESITSAYAIMRIHLSAINVDSDLLVASVMDALQVLNMIDSYLDTRKIANVKQVLELE